VGQVADATRQAVKCQEHARWAAQKLPRPAPGSNSLGPLSAVCM